MAPLLLMRMLAAAAVLAACIFAVACNGAFYQPTRLRHSDPAKLGVRFSDFGFESRDGTRLHGRLLRRESDAPARGLVVQFHGNAQNLSAHALSMIWILAHGYDLFVFDYPGYGESEGMASRPGTIAAGKAALDFVSDSLLATGEYPRLIVAGQSLGGAILMRCLPEWKDKDRVTLALAEGSFPSYRRMAASVLSRNWITYPFQPLAYVLVGGADNPVPWIPRISPTPFLVVGCGQDAVVDPEYSTEIYHRAKEPKWLWEFPACGHIQAFGIPEARARLLALADSLADGLSDTQHP